MQLRAISFQHGLNLPDQPLNQIYNSVTLGGSEQSSDFFKAIVQAISALILYLEERVQAPSHWVMTSHANLVLFPCDFSQHSTEILEQQVAYISFLHYLPMLFEISSPHLRVDAPIGFVAHIQGVEAAGDFIG